MLRPLTSIRVFTRRLPAALAATVTGLPHSIFTTQSTVTRDVCWRQLSTTGANSAVFGIGKLRGQCACGSVGWVASGPSAMNFVCHCSVCRKASGQPYLPAAGFKPEQVQWVNKDGMVEVLPPGSRNKRYYCKCCGTYIAEDATRPLGVLALPLSAVEQAARVDTHKHSTPNCTDPSCTIHHPSSAPVDKELPSLDKPATVREVDMSLIPEEYRPNLHIFYADRVVECKDNAPKWKTLPQDEIMDNGGSRHDSNAEHGPQGVNTPWGLSDEANNSAGQDGGSYPRAQYDAGAGRFRKDVLPASPPRPPYSKVYHFTETDPIPNNTTYIAPEKVSERVARKYYPSPGKFVAPMSKKRQVLIIGGGHNGLVSAAYLAKAGVDVCVLERRHIVGGAAITEEIFPGYKFSRASYLAGLLRPSIIEDLNLTQYGFKYIPRNPSSFTPSLVNGPLGGKYLMLGDDAAQNRASIAQFSERDADAFEKYEEFLGKVREVVQPLLDGPPPNPLQGKFRERMRAAARLKDLISIGVKNREVVVPFYELFTAPASHILDRWFESEMLKTTLATDAVIGAMCSPTHAGSAYVLLHHVMGEAAGKKGVWSYIEGGMGAVSNAIAQSAKSYGAEIVTNATVSKILYQERTDGGPARVKGVRMVDGTEIHADIVLSNATPYHTFLELLPGLSRDSGNKDESSPLPPDFQHHIRFADYQCGAFKINCAVDKLPNYECFPSPADGTPGPQHRGTAHFENRMEEIEHAHREASMGMPATRPVVEMTIPSALDPTVAPPGKHVVQFFVQFAPYDVDPKYGNWADPGFKNAFADRVFGIVDQFCPGFSSSVLHRDILSPLDLERIFGLHKGNIFHGSLTLHQLGYTRPAFGYSSHRTPMDGLYLCGAGAHPGGGVMGAAGKNCAQVVLSDLGIA